MQKLTAEDIRDQVKRMLSSAPLSNSEILSGLLHFIVNETLAGRGNDLKEYNIAVNALNREQNFNPQLDSIVRIHAGRLRRALREYYYEAGVKDPIAIQVPKGSYVPTFELRAIPVSVTSADRNDADASLTIYANERHHQKPVSLQPKLYFSYKDKSSIAVLPFKKIGLGKNLRFFSQSIGEYLSTELTLFKNLKVLSYYSGYHIAAQMCDIRSIGTTLEADYLITGCVQGFADNVACVYVHLNRTATGDQLWARTYKRDPNQRHDQFLEYVVENIVASLTGIDGVIARHETSKSTPLSGEIKNGHLTYWYSQYRTKFDKPTMTKAKNYFQDVVKAGPQNALALSYLSEILSNEMLLLQSFDQNVMELGLAYALQAIKIDPYCQQGYQALAINKLRSKDLSECLRALELGLDINPKSVDYKGTMGALLIYAGQFESGAKILSQAVTLNCRLPWWQILSYSYYLYHQRSYKEALLWADRTNKNIVWVPLVKAACYSQLGQLENGTFVLEQMKQQFVFEDLSEDGLKKIFNSDKILSEIMDGLRKLPYIFIFVVSYAFL